MISSERHALQTARSGKPNGSKVLADAKKEERGPVAGPPGSAYRDVMRGFEKKYPEITLEFQSFTPTNFTARFSKERQAGQYLWDLYVTGPTGFDVSAKKAGDLDPIRPLFILPEVLDEKSVVRRIRQSILGFGKTIRLCFPSANDAASLGQPRVCCGKRFEQHQRALGRQMERQDRHQRSPRRWRRQWPYRAVDRAVRRGVRDRSPVAPGFNPVAR